MASQGDNLSLDRRAAPNTSPDSRKNGVPTTLINNKPEQVIASRGKGLDAVANLAVDTKVPGAEQAQEEVPPEEGTLARAKWDRLKAREAEKARLNAELKSGKASVGVLSIDERSALRPVQDRLKELAKAAQGAVTMGFGENGEGGGVLEEKDMLSLRAALLSNFPDTKTFVKDNGSALIGIEPKGGTLVVSYKRDNGKKSKIVITADGKIKA